VTNIADPANPIVQALTPPAGIFIETLYLPGGGFTTVRFNLKTARFFADPSILYNTRMNGYETLVKLRETEIREAFKTAINRSGFYWSNPTHFVLWKNEQATRIFLSTCGQFFVNATDVPEDVYELPEQAPIHPRSRLQHARGVVPCLTYGEPGGWSDYEASQANARAEVDSDFERYGIDRKGQPAEVKIAVVKRQQPKGGYVPKGQR